MNKRAQFAAIVVLLLSVFALGAVTVINLATQVTGLLPKTNGGTGITSTATFPASGTVTVTFESGTSAMGTAAIASGACSAAVTTAVTSLATTDRIVTTLNAVPTGTNMYSWLEVYGYPTSGNVNIVVCNPSAASRTPTAMTVNWQVLR